jgi:hypothetical protein
MPSLYHRPASSGAGLPELSHPGPHQWRRKVLAVGTAMALVSLMVAAASISGAPSASAAPAVNLASSSSFAVLANQSISNVGAGTALLSGSLGLTPNGPTSISGSFGFVAGTGAEHAADAVAGTAQTDAFGGAGSGSGGAYHAAATASSTGTVTTGNLATQNSPGSVVGTYTPGVYASPSSMSLDGTITLKGDPSSVFIFQMPASTLTVGATLPSSVVLAAAAGAAGPVQACHVFWQVGSSATLDTNTTNFVGNILALTSITLNAGPSVQGRLLAGGGSVVVDDNTITAPSCASATTTAASASAVTVGSSVNDVATVTGNTTDGVPTGAVQTYECGPPATTCSSGGTLLGSAPLNGAGIATSPSFTPGSTGTYCFAAVYTPDITSTYGSSSGAPSLPIECFLASASSGSFPTGPPTPSAAPTVTTSAASATLVVLGKSVNDIVTVTGNSSNGVPTGSVQTSVCGPPSTLCATTSGTALSPAGPLTNGVSASPAFTPGAVGTYCFASVYTPARGSAYAASSEAGSVLNGECFTVTATPGVPPAVTPPPTVTTTAASASSITLGQAVHDVVTVTGNGTDGVPTGSVQTYECGPPSILCAPTSGTAISPAVALSGGVATSQGFTPSSVGTYCFAAVFTPLAGSPYVASSEAGSPSNAECFTVTAAAVKKPVSTVVPGRGTRPGAGRKPTGTIIPLGAPGTGAGGASHSSSSVLFGLSGLALAGAALAAAEGSRRRRARA